MSSDIPEIVADQPEVPAPARRPELWAVISMEDEERKWWMSPHTFRTREDANHFIAYEINRQTWTNCRIVRIPGEP